MGHRRLTLVVEQFEQVAEVRLAHGVEHEIGVGHIHNVYIPLEECNRGRAGPQWCSRLLIHRTRQDQFENGTSAAFLALVIRWPR